MSNNFDKIVKLACKPKNAPPKAKYVDVLIAATYADDGSLAEIIRSLALRLREPNAVIVFKGLLTLHQMIRAGSTDNLLEFLSSSDQLRLRNITGQNWEGYKPPANLGYYAGYLDTRVRSFRELKHDPVFLQTESNRRSTGLSANSKARRLRNLPVDKGLLREVKQVQRILDSLVMCRFYDDDLRDENTVLAYRMLVKDLLVLFQAGNEGVCNILEHYFEMSKVDATESFEIYQSFIKQTDKIVDYLSMARRLHNIVNVPVPNLKHAPTSLVKALEEYLNDPNFEQNRLDYKRSLGVVEGKSNSGTSPVPNSETSTKATTAPVASESVTASSSSAAPAPPPGAPQKIQDFFDSIQADQQPTIFGGNQQTSAQPQVSGFNPQIYGGFNPQMGMGMPQMNMPMQQMPMQQQPTGNPFRQSMTLPQQTGYMQTQMTGFGMPQQGFLQPQQTGALAFGNSPFAQSQQQQQQQSPFAQSQAPQTAGFLQPQTTGANPFRQSVLFPINTGAPGPSGAFSQPASPFGGLPPPSAFALGGAPINRPGSTPALGSAAYAAPPAGAAKTLVAQPTGSKNPFAPAGGSAPAVASPVSPRGPSMNELAQSRFNQQFALAGGLNPQPAVSTAVGASSSGAANPSTSPWDPLAPTPGQTGAATSGGSAMSDIASAFAVESKPAPNDFLSQFGSLSVNTGVSSATAPGSFASPSGMRAQATGSPNFLQPQRTGYGGSLVKPFKPTSTFGSSLMETLPPIPEPSGGPESAPAAPTSPLSAPPLGGMPFGTQAQQPFGARPSFSANSSFSGFNPGSGGVAAQPTGFQPTSNFGQALTAQATGGANPFRASMFGGQGAQPTGVANAGTAGSFGSSSPFVGQNGVPQQQQQQQQPGAGAFGAGSPFQQAYAQQSQSLI